jgi:PAS domain S-box-containing protein
LKISVDLVLNAPSIMVLLWSDRLLQIGNDRFCAALRVSQGDTLARPAGEESWRQGWATVKRHCDRALRGEATHGRIALGDQPESEAKAAFSPIHEEDGRVAGVLISLTDDEASRSGAGAARRSVPDVIDDLPGMTWLAGQDGAWITTNRQWEAFTGLSTAQSSGSQWMCAVEARDLATLTKAWLNALEARTSNLVQASLEVDHRLYCVAEARYRWVRHRARPVFDDTGSLAGWVGDISDIDDLKRKVAQHAADAAELQRQIRNSFAVMRSMIRRTAESAESLDEYVLHLDGRFGSFARIQAKLMHMPDMTLDLEDLVLDELTAHAALSTDQCHVAGPPLRLRAKLAESLGMVFHELTTNAVKFGALASPVGRIDISWEIARPLTHHGAAGVLNLVWEESGVSMPARSPGKRGFAKTLIEDIIPYEFDANARIDVLSDGVMCTLIIPLTAWIAPEEGALN